jgi:hypothetical protein
MKNSIKTISRTTVAYTALFGLVLSQAFMANAWAQNSTMQSGSMHCHEIDTQTPNAYPNGHGSSGSPTSSFGMATTPSNGTVCGSVLGGTTAFIDSECPSGGGINGAGYACWTPEMSDYLAISFVVVAGGMMYHFRRRALVQA